MTERFYFRQLLSGLDFALDDPVAEQMVNFVYAFGDRETGEAVLVDPAYRPTELIELVEADGMRVSGVFATHYHADHVGGSSSGGRTQDPRHRPNLLEETRRASRFTCRPTRWSG